MAAHGTKPGRKESERGRYVAQYIQGAGLRLDIPGKEDGFACKCGQKHGIYIRPTYDGSGHVQYCLCQKCVVKNALATKSYITVTNVNAAADPDLPSHLFPGSGSDGAAFKVTSGEIPNRELMYDLLYDNIVDCNLNQYDENAGVGYFTIIDGDAPPSGTVIPLVGKI